MRSRAAIRYSKAIFQIAKESNNLPNIKDDMDSIISAHESSEDFKELLTRPQHFIFNREYYENCEGKPEFDDYTIQMKSLSNSEKEELNVELSKTTPGNFHEIKFSNQRLKRILSFYLPLTDEEEKEIWSQKQKNNKNKSEEIIYIPDDEKVEDAGYNDMAFKPIQDTWNKIQPNAAV